MADFTSSFNQNDEAYIFTSTGVVKTTITKLSFREDTSFVAFNPNTDFIYSFVNGEERPQGLTFASKEALITYINSLP